MNDIILTLILFLALLSGVHSKSDYKVIIFQHYPHQCGS